jgi:hypothetical protein
MKLCLSCEGRFDACCVVPLLATNAETCTCVMLPRRCQSDPLSVLWCPLHPSSCLCTQLTLFWTPNSWNFRAAEVRRCNEFSRCSCVVWYDVLSLVIFIHVPFLKGRKLHHEVAMKSFFFYFSALIFLVDKFWQSLVWTLCHFRTFHSLVFNILQCVMTVCRTRKLVTWVWL